MFKKALSSLSFVVFALGALLLPMSETFVSKTSAEGNAPSDSLQSIVYYGENFDALPAPQLPAGWTTSATGAGTNFAAVTNESDSAPNSVFAPAPSLTASSELTSPPILVTGANSVLRFRHRYSIENTWDGAVLEVKTGGGNFVDILDAGGAFLEGGYTTFLNPSPNPLANRFAWSGATQGFVSTAVRLPASMFGQSVQFRWRVGTNDDFGVNGWWVDSVTLENVATAANTTPITISSAGTASPYPAAVAVSGLSGLITNISVRIENFSHAFPDDVDLLLVAPNGRSIVLMSDAGGGTPANNVSLTFSDAAAQNLPDNSPLATGIYRPTDFEPLDTFPSPAPQVLSGTVLSAFYGSSPNGNWALYAVDDQTGNAGAIAGGWNLNLSTSQTACLPSVSPNALAFPAAGGSGALQITAPIGCGWTISTVNPFITFTSPTSGSGSGTVTYQVAPNSGVARTGLITVSDGINSRTVQIQQASGCPTAISQENINIPAAGGSANIQVTAEPGCNWQTFSNVNWIQPTSPPQSGNGMASFTVAANASGAPRTGIVNVGTKTILVTQAGGTRARFDFDGDGRADVAVYRGGNWFIQQSTNGFTGVSFGVASDKIVPADYDGDGKTDIGVFRSGNWYILRSSDSAFASASFGLAADVPVPADYDGDGRAEVAVFRSGNWYTLNLTNNQINAVNFGQTGDLPVPADYDADGKTDVAVYRGGNWYILRSQAGFAAVQFGAVGDTPVPADYDGNGQADIAVFRSGSWYRLLNFQTFSGISFGASGDLPVAADYDGDGKTDVAVYRGGAWYALRSSDAQLFAVQFGVAGDRPVPHAFVP